MTVIIPIAIIAGILAWVLRPSRETIKTRWLAILATTIPLVVTVIVALLFQYFQNSTGGAVVSGVANNLFVTGLCLIGIVVISLIGFAFTRKVEIVKGIGFGLTINVILSLVQFVSLEAIAGI
ncbi:MAG: hypothetical protein ACYDG5_08015 [Dehalococcoidales bacterium]